MRAGSRQRRSGRSTGQTASQRRDSNGLSDAAALKQDFQDLARAVGETAAATASLEPGTVRLIPIRMPPFG